MSPRPLIIHTRPREFQDVTSRIDAIVQAGDVTEGLCHVFLRHTSASVLICENADPSVRRDLERFMLRMAPDERADYEHDAEGPDDMPAHIRSVLAGVSLSVPVMAGRLGLGTWQGIYVWEHRTASHERELVVTVQST